MEKITFVSAWYDVGAKFTKEQYYIWAKNLLENVRQFYLIVYVENAEMAHLIYTLSEKNAHVYIIILPLEKFPLYIKYKRKFEENHTRNIELNRRVSWKLIILWCSKQYLVQNTEDNIKKGTRGFPAHITDYYGWMDIGYFRSRENLQELSAMNIRNFPNNIKLNELNKEKIHYAIVNPSIIHILERYVFQRNMFGLPTIPLPMNQISVAGGFFILAKGGMSKKWRELFESHIDLYLKHNYTIKDDQYIIIDLILLYKDMFHIWTEHNHGTDPWFLFQRLLY